MEEDEDTQRKDKEPMETSTIGIRRTNSKYYVFTENDEAHLQTLKEMLISGQLPVGVAYMIAQVEKAPETDHLHLQGYVELVNRKRIQWLKNHISRTAHFEKRRGTQAEAIAYCQKEETREEGPWELGAKAVSQQGKRNDLLEVKKFLDEGVSVVDIVKQDTYFATGAKFYKFFDWYSKHAGLKNPPRTAENIVEVILMIGAPGTGKTRDAAKEWPSAYWKPSQTRWWDGYQGEKCVIFDDFNHGWFTWDSFMRIIDRYPLKVEYKGGYVDFCATTMVFTTNTHPRYWYKGMLDRWPALERRITKIIHYTVDEDPNEISIDDLPYYGQPELPSENNPIY